MRVTQNNCSPLYQSPTTNKDNEGAYTRSTSDLFTVSTFSHTRYAVHAVRADLMADGFSAIRVSSPDTAIDLIAWNDQEIILIAAHTVRNHLQISEVTTRFSGVIMSLRTCPVTRYTTRELRIIRQGHASRIFTIYPGGIMEKTGIRRKK